MRVDAFDFDLPAENIALRPASPRHSSRLLEIDPAREQPLSDFSFSDLPHLLRAGDALVFNDTKVIPARLKGVRTGRGDFTPKIEVTLHKNEGQGRWLAFARPAKKLQDDDWLSFGGGQDMCLASGLKAQVLKKGEAGEVLLAFEFTDSALEEALHRFGEMPLPPYIASKRATDAQDLEDYQTIFAQKAGAVAAPTAGLHFTPEILQALDERNIARYNVTLHVGAGTFLPVKVDDTQDHKMHFEYGEISQQTAKALNETRKNGGRIIAVGTTSLRLLESAASPSGEILPFSADTDIFMIPGYRFKAADMLLTNFHLPRSTLFMLVCAFSGTKVMKEAYDHAIATGYRFYSYGDSSLLSLQKGSAL